MKLEAGKKYVDHRGRIYGPLVYAKGLYGEKEGETTWHDDGRMSFNGVRTGDLIAEHVEFVPGNHWVTPVNDFVFTVGGVGAGGPSFRMPDQDADFVGEFDGIVYSNDPMHVLRAGVDQVCVLGKWTTWSKCGSSMLEETAFTRVRYPKSAAPVKAHVTESPDDLVEITDASHKLRKLIDFVWSVSDKEWTPVRGLAGCTVGYVRESLPNSYTKPSCYRKNLPVPQIAIDSVEVELCVNKINPYAFCLLARPAGEFNHGEVALRFADGKFYIDTPKADS